MGARCTLFVDLDDLPKCCKVGEEAGDHLVVDDLVLEFGKLDFRLLRGAGEIRENGGLGSRRGRSAWISAWDGRTSLGKVAIAFVGAGQANWYWPQPVHRVSETTGTPSTKVRASGIGHRSTHSVQLEPRRLRHRNGRI